MNTHKSIIEELEWRGNLHDISHKDELSNLLEKEPSAFYCGFDPTADSLHVGSLLPLTTIKRFISHGHRAIILIGSATGMIGDPSGKSQERTLLSKEQLDHNSKSLEKQIRNFMFGDSSIKSEEQVLFVSNADWLSKLSFIDILREIGKDFSVNYMMGKDSVKSRLSEREQGISYTEFSYMLLQAYDFNYLYKNNKCILQIGGSDQWGNITAGLDYIRKNNPGAKQAFGLTFPLITNADGQKFGKSESGTIWLDKTRTSPYAYYQFWLNVTDEDIEKYLKLFSMKNSEEISNLMAEHREKPEKRSAQRALAEELCSSLHGEPELKKVLQASEALFSQTDNPLLGESLVTLAGEIPTLKLSGRNIEDLPIQELLIECKAAESKSAARRLIDNGGVSLNHAKIKDPLYKLKQSDLLENKAMLIRTGKKNYFLVVS